jgi:hypothetical protein
MLLSLGRVGLSRPERVLRFLELERQQAKVTLAECTHPRHHY